MTTPFRNALFSTTSHYGGATAVLIAGLDRVPANMRPYLIGMTTMRSEDAPTAGAPTVFVTPAMAAGLFGATSLDSVKSGTAGSAVGGTLVLHETQAPGRNVVALLPGSDPALRGQYVAIGAHNDHVGYTHQPVDHDSLRALNMVARPQGADSPAPGTLTDEQQARVRVLIDSLRALHPARQDSIFNGADDDGSGSMSVLEIAEAFATAKQKPKRSILFVWHTGEEAGLYGSAHFTDHPTVPRDSIVAQLNMDMVGRGGANDVTGETKGGDLTHGGPGYLQLVGSRRLSTELGDLIEQVNRDNKLGFSFDYSMDANGHPQNIYCRSDHYEYARYGIPIVFFTTGGHSDYHQVTDEPQYIDYDRMAGVASLVYDAAWKVADLDHRVVVDKAKPNPKGACVQ
jgi:Zn-dependent M28 family amino/carboxypeptidase